MFYEDPNTNPNSEGLNNESAAAPEQRSEGEYHYNRQTTPGTQSEPVNQSAQSTGSASGAQGNPAPSGAESAQSGGGSAPNSGYSAPNPGYSGASAPNSGYSAPNPGYSGGSAPNPGYSHQSASGTTGASRPNTGYTAPHRTVPPRPKAAPVTPPTPPKKRSGGAGKVVALALACSLLGGMVGAGGMYALKGGLSGSSGQATVSVSDRTEESEGGVNMTTAAVSAGESMTPAQIYKEYGDAVVCIFISSSSGTGAGTGFIIDGKEGYVLTCYHVVDGAKSVSVKLNDSTEYVATYVGGDKERDCAILKITPKDGETLNLKSVVLGDSKTLAVGESVCTIGNALGTLANTLTSGTISALDRSESMEDGTVMNVLQTDTSINGGNSGGPLFNSYGEVIGIVNSKRLYTSSGTNVEGIAFAIPISDVTEVMSDLMEHGYITGRPLMGVSLATITAATAQQYADLVPGAYVTTVQEGSCAEKAGVQEGDIITSFDGKEVTSSAEVIELKRQHKAGDEVEMVVNRKGEDVLIKLTLDEDTSHDNPINDGSSEGEQPGDSGYGFGYGGDSNGSGGYGYGSNGGFGFPFPFFGGW